MKYNCYGLHCSMVLIAPCEFVSVLGIILIQKCMFEITGIICTARFSFPVLVVFSESLNCVVVGYVVERVLTETAICRGKR